MGNLCQSVISHGNGGMLVDIECHVSNNLPTIVIVGFAGRAVHEAKDRLRGAFASCGLQLPRKRVTINLAPADIPKTESCLDLAIAASIIACSADTRLPDGILLGELGLDGGTRPIRGLIGKLLAGRSHGICSYFVPEANLEQGMLVPGITLYPVANLRQLADHINGSRPINPISSGAGTLPPLTQPASAVTFDDISGQDSAKRALIIAAAGGHNVLMTGPPGTGKSLLAQTLGGLMPRLSHEELLEVTQLSSLTSDQYQQLPAGRPIRTPHHTISTAAMIGGGNHLRPGEISLSHHGVLVLDEFPEFASNAIEALRQPLERHTITVARGKDSVEYPAKFTLVATANPCPCGYYGFDSQRCNCAGALLRRYQNRLSGPILDRIDLCCDVHQIDHTKLLKTTSGQQQSAIDSIVLARQRQAERYGSTTITNGSLSNRQLRSSVKLTRPAVLAIQDAAHRLQLSARGYMRTIKVAQTIADLAGAVIVGREHVAEALSYRQR